MTMLALTLAVGIVIDDAIVVLENIFRFIEEKGMAADPGGGRGDTEIGLAVLATTLSLIAIFLPVGFMGGIVGRFMKSFGLTMSFAILVSLLVSFTLTPMLAARWIKMKPRPKARDAVDGERSKDSTVLPAARAVYTRSCSWSLAHRWVVAGRRGARPAEQRAAFMVANKNFLPEDDQSEFEVGLRAPEGHEPRGDRDHRQPDRGADAADARRCDYTLVTIGDDPARTQNLGTVYVRLKPLDERDRDQFEVMDEVRDRVLPQVGVANLRTGVRPVATFGGGGNQNAEIQFTINGPDLEQLERFGDGGRRRGAEGAGRGRRRHVAHRRQAGAVGAHRPLKAADLGVQVADVAEALRLLVGGDQVTTYDEGGEQYEVHVRAARRATAADAAGDRPADRAVVDASAACRSRTWRS